MILCYFIQFIHIYMYFLNLNRRFIEKIDYFRSNICRYNSWKKLETTQVDWIEILISKFSCVYIQSTTKLFGHQSLLKIFIHISESNAGMIPGFYMLISTKKIIILNFLKNRLNTTNLTKIEGKIICIVEHIILNCLIRVSISNLHTYFIIEAF